MAIAKSKRQEVVKQKTLRQAQWIHHQKVNNYEQNNRDTIDEPKQIAEAIQEYQRRGEVQFASDKEPSDLYSMPRSTLEAVLNSLDVATKFNIATSQTIDDFFKSKLKQYFKWEIKIVVYYIIFVCYLYCFIVVCGSILFGSSFSVVLFFVPIPWGII